MSDMVIFDFLELIAAVLGIAYAYMSVLTVVGIFTTRRFPEAKKNHRYAVVIAARNEENVIGQLLESINGQTYPRELVTTFVVADNCTDRTAEIARAYGAVCYERFNSANRTKGYALQYLFGQISRDYGTDTFEGYFVFDADNILNPDYIEKMNNAFDSGEKIITSYRNTKNWEDGCVAASYAIHWMRTVRCENRAKSSLGMACRVQGTGFLFSNELVANGWRFVDLTEDRSFCIDAVRRGYRISFQEEAEFYDEQPENLAIAFRQRIRWSKGHLQAFYQSGRSLLKRCFTSGLRNALTAYDMLMITFPVALAQVWINLLELIICVAIICLDGSSPVLLSTWLRGALLTFLGDYVGNVATGAYTMVMERAHVPAMPLKRKILYCLTFPMFSILGSVTSCIASVSRVEWKPTPHRAAANARMLVRNRKKRLSGAFSSRRD